MISNTSSPRKSPPPPSSMPPIETSAQTPPLSNKYFQLNEHQTKLVSKWKQSPTLELLQEECQKKELQFKPKIYIYGSRICELIAYSEESHIFHKNVQSYFLDNKKDMDIRIEIPTLTGVDQLQTLLSKAFSSNYKWQDKTLSAGTLYKIHQFKALTNHQKDSTRNPETIPSFDISITNYTEQSKPYSGLAPDPLSRISLNIEQNKLNFLHSKEGDISPPSDQHLSLLHLNYANPSYINPYTQVIEKHAQLLQDMLNIYIQSCETAIDSTKQPQNIFSSNPRKCPKLLTPRQTLSKKKIPHNKNKSQHKKDIKKLNSYKSYLTSCNGMNAQQQVETLKKTAENDEDFCNLQFKNSIAVDIFKINKQELPKSGYFYINQLIPLLTSNIKLNNQNTDHPTSTHQFKSAKTEPATFPSNTLIKNHPNPTTPPVSLKITLESELNESIDCLDKAIMDYQKSNKNTYSKLIVLCSFCILQLLWMPSTIQNIFLPLLCCQLIHGITKINHIISTKNNHIAYLKGQKNNISLSLDALKKHIKPTVIKHDLLDIISNIRKKNLQINEIDNKNLLNKLKEIECALNHKPKSPCYHSQ